MSTSTPRTCTSPKSQKDAKPVDRAPKRHRAHETPTLDLKQLIPRVMLSQNEKIVRKFCADSLQRICDEYEIDVNIPTFRKLRDFAADSQQSHNSILALFFLCMDIDIRFKQMMTSAESESMKHKLTGFFTQLRSNVIPMFFCEEHIDADELVSQVHETYILA
jgi:hypothetical protein